MTDSAQEIRRRQFARDAAERLRPRPGSGIDSVSFEVEGAGSVTLHSDGRTESTMPEQTRLQKMTSEEREAAERALYSAIRRWQSTRAEKRLAVREFNEAIKEVEEEILGLERQLREDLATASGGE